MQVVTKTSELAAACQRLARHSYVAVDTEFMRETTFWPKLCLVQLAGPADEVILDPLAKDLELKPLFELMADTAVTKVFHAARQDVEIFWNLGRVIPTPIFDTQVAAMVCGFGEAVSYTNIVKKVLDEDVDKSSRFTDWSRRPLTDHQLSYALADVTHLRHVFVYLKDQLDRDGRVHWLFDEMATLTDPMTYETAPEHAWKRLKSRVKSRRALAVLMELARWREAVAQSQDVPRQRVLKDEALYDIANHAPMTQQALGDLRSVHQGFARSERGREVLEAVARGKQRPLDEVPQFERAKPLPPEATAVAEMLRVLLKAVAAEHGVATKVIATADDLEAIASDDRAEVPALKGWRRTLFGEKALALKHGDLGLAVIGAEVRTVPLGNGVASSK
jgi:ribonuclease D